MFSISTAERAADRGAPTDAVSLLVEIATEEMVARPMANWAAERAVAVAGKSRVYRYRVEHPGAGPQLQATHTVETPSVLRNLGRRRPGAAARRSGRGDSSVADLLQTAWSRFIHDGDPGWPALTSHQSEDLPVFEFGA